MMIRGLTGACHSLSSHLWVYASLYTILPHSFTGWSVIEQLENGLDRSYKPTATIHGDVSENG